MPVRVRVIGILLVMCAPVAFVYGAAAHFAVNVPWFDDYSNFLDFAVQLHHLPKLSDQLAACWTVQHLQYKLVFMHLLALLEMRTLHHIDLIWLSLLGDLSLLLLLGILWRIYRLESAGLEKRLLAFVPVVYLVFSMNYLESVDWASASLFYVPAMALSFIAIHTVAEARSPERPRRFLMACLTGILACWVSPNAGLLLPIGLVVLLARRAYAKAALWSAALVCGVLPYLSHYVWVSGDPSVGHHTSLGTYVRFLMSVMGADRPPLGRSVALGCLILLIVIAAMVTGYARRNVAAVLCTLWVVGSLAILTVVRAPEGMGEALTFRYTVYSDVLLVFCYGFAVQTVDRAALSAATKRWLLAAAWMLTMLNCWNADRKAFDQLRWHREQLLEGIARYRAAPTVNPPEYFSGIPADSPLVQAEAMSMKSMTEALENGVYQLPGGDGK